MSRGEEARLLAQLDNPFRTGSARAQALDLPRELAERAQEQPSRLEALLLAVLHARALSGASYAELADAPLLPTRLERRLPRPRTTYARLCHASARCAAQLDAMRGTSEPMRRVRETVWSACFGLTLAHALALERVIRDHDVLITGETGTGKEEIARAIARAAVGDEGASAPYAEINVSAVPEALVESELFGHAKGAFTGAAHARAGLVRSAHRGCLFLDEIGDLPATAQVKLLRVIETDQVQPLGEGKVHQVDVRFIAATHHDLLARVREGRFRADLYQRIAGVVVRLPALRERPEDIAAIGADFVTRALAGTGIDSAPHLAWVNGAAVRAYTWPGNVRELQNALRNRLLGLAESARDVLRDDGREASPVPLAVAEGTATLEEVELWYMRRAIERTGGNLAQAARLLGVDRTTLARRVRGG